MKNCFRYIKSVDRLLLYRVCWLKMILFWQNGLLTCASAQVKTLWYVMNKYEILGVVGEGQFDWKPQYYQITDIVKFYGVPKFSC